LKSQSRVNRRHYKWCHSIDWYGFLLVFYSNVVRRTVYEILYFKYAVTLKTGLGARYVVGNVVIR